MDKTPCVDSDGTHLLLDKFMLISDYCKHMNRLLSFIYAYVDENLLVSSICAIKASIKNINEKALEAKQMICYATCEGGKGYVH
ncbi:MAG: hypothetical protein ACPLIG_04495 [Candidatus Bathyarchaeales archaeon]